MEILYRDEEEFLKDLKKLNSKLRAKTIRILEVIETEGIEFVDVKSLGEEIFEIRIRYANDAFRILFMFDKTIRNVIVISHGFVKKTRTTPKKEISKAKKRFRL